MYFLSHVAAGRDTYQEGLSCYRLGNAYEGIREHDTAIQVGSILCIIKVVNVHVHTYMYTSCVAGGSVFQNCSTINVIWSAASTTMMMRGLAMHMRLSHAPLKGMVIV